jgi:hypothetical protein
LKVTEINLKMAIKLFFLAVFVAVASAQLPDLGGVTGGLPDTSGLTGGLPVDVPVPVGGGGDSEGGAPAESKGSLFGNFFNRRKSRN